MCACPCGIDRRRSCTKAQHHWRSHVCVLSAVIVHCCCYCYADCRYCVCYYPNLAASHTYLVGRFGERENGSIKLNTDRIRRVLFVPSRSFYTSPANGTQQPLDGMHCFHQVYSIPYTSPATMVHVQRFLYDMKRQGIATTEDGTVHSNSPNSRLSVNLSSTDSKHYLELLRTIPQLPKCAPPLF